MPSREHWPFEGNGSELEARTRRHISLAQHVGSTDSKSGNLTIITYLVTYGLAHRSSYQSQLGLGCVLDGGNHGSDNSVRGP